MSYQTATPEILYLHFKVQATSPSADDVATPDSNDNTAFVGDPAATRLKCPALSSMSWRGSGGSFVAGAPALQGGGRSQEAAVSRQELYYMYRNILVIVDSGCTCTVKTDTFQAISFSKTQYYVCVMSSYLSRRTSSSGHGNLCFNRRRRGFGTWDNPALSKWYSSDE
ncbi:hypothetical protein SISNIDRAFT_469452 [Sistotremastrum niveocremeum HHB9708]|uniref:Uncharacterized protein n=1 Tax=Sistotremastrum niveocremeum HHB9708 TaxID=1314777 RepID=A0A164Q8Q4_9AGAM|nr:hypothetical protein SISNIDRAFT_469452 [Sistotremastrum niveocremeum HHB9708]